MARRERPPAAPLRPPGTAFAAAVQALCAGRSGAYFGAGFPADSASIPARFSRLSTRHSAAIRRISGGLQTAWRGERSRCSGRHPEPRSEPLPALLQSVPPGFEIALGTGNGGGARRLRATGRPAVEALAPESQLARAAAASGAGTSLAAVRSLAARTSFSRFQASIVVLTM